MPAATHEARASAGWPERSIQKLCLAGAAGASGGAILSVAQQAPLLRYSAATAASCTFVMACFTVLLEGTRALRNMDSPANSIIASGVTGYTFTALLRGRARAAPAAVWFAAGGGLAHASADLISAKGGMRSTLGALGLMEAPESDADFGPTAEPQEEDRDWSRWIPFVHKMSVQEWEDYKRRKQENFDSKVRAARGEAPLEGQTDSDSSH